jgi:hypothetical protein
MGKFSENLKRKYARINKDRRELLGLAFKEFPNIVDCSLVERFSWDSPKGRTAIFDLYYLESAGYVEITAPLLQTLQDEGSGKLKD